MSAPAEIEKHSTSNATNWRFVAILLGLLLVAVVALVGFGILGGDGSDSEPPGDDSEQVEDPDGAETQKG
ncbi:MAG: hypothetical protein AAGA90_01360 [Actinomycetota bacterium]